MKNDGFKKQLIKLLRYNLNHEELKEKFGCSLEFIANGMIDSIAESLRLSHLAKKLPFIDPSMTKSTIRSGKHAGKEYGFEYVDDCWGCGYMCVEAIINGKVCSKTGSESAIELANQLFDEHL